MMSRPVFAAAMNLRKSRYRMLVKELIDKLRNLVLRFALPKEQYYIQCGEFHSVFHPIMKPLLSRTEMYGESNENDNSE